MQLIRDQRLFDLMVKHFELMLQLETEDILDYLAGAVKIEEGSVLVWRDERGRYHRDGDKPALIYADGTKIWYLNGKMHRDGDKPAEILVQGYYSRQAWYKHGNLHRDGNQPAIICDNGHREWWVKGEWVR